MIPRIVGHRGAAGIAPENSIEGFRKAAEHVKCVELDVHSSLEGVPVVVHDESKIKGFTADEAQRAGIPLLSDVLDMLDRLDVIAIVEIKTYTSKILDAVKGRNVYLSSFHSNYISHISSVPVLFNSWHPVACPTWAAGVVCDCNHVVKSTGLLGAFTVNDVETANDLFNQDVDFIITDRPDILCSLS